MSTIQATPVHPIVFLDGDGVERKVISVITDPNIGVPLYLLQTDSGFWGKPGGIGKVEMVMAAFKNDATIKEACFYAGITLDQYYYFVKIHPMFSYIKDACWDGVGMLAKAMFMRGLREGGKYMEQARLALDYLKGSQPGRYKQSVLPDITPGGSLARQSEEVWRDKEGKVTVSKKTAEIIHGGNSNH